MAATNNAVTISAGLSCSTLTAPAIGTSLNSLSLAYTDGHVASDNYVNVSATAIPGTALFTALGGDGFVMITNPATNTYACDIYLDQATDLLIGSVPVGCSVVFPIAAATVLTGVVTAAQNVGVTCIRTTANV